MNGWNYFSDTIDIIVYRSEPFYMTKPSEYTHDLVHVLKERMGLDHRYIEALNEMSYNELVECVENHTYAIVMTDLSMTSSRSDEIEFSCPK